MKSSSKEAAAKNILNYSTVFVYLKVHQDKVAVPEHLWNKDYIVLQIGYDMPVPIPDLRIDKSGISGTLSFHGKSSFCNIPWEAVFKLEDESGTHFYYGKDAPKIKKINTNPPLQLVKSTKQSKSRPRLTLIKGGKSA